MALSAPQHLKRTEQAIESVIATAAGHDPVKTLVGSVNMLPPLLVSHCSSDYKMPFQWSVTINWRGFE